MPRSGKSSTAVQTRGHHLHTRTSSSFFHPFASPLLSFSLFNRVRPPSSGSSHQNACSFKNAGAFPARLAPEPQKRQRCQPSSVLVEVAERVGSSQHLPILCSVREIKAACEHWYYWSRRPRKGQSLVSHPQSLSGVSLHVPSSPETSFSLPSTLWLATGKFTNGREL
jgi:hypothetical protein